MVLRFIALPMILNYCISKSARTHIAKQAVIDCMLDIEQWSSSHRLKLNAAKSEVIWLGTRQQLTRLSQADMILQLNNSVLLQSSNWTSDLFSTYSYIFNVN